MSSLTVHSTKTLLSKTTIPLLGFGVWDSPSEKTTQSCLSALKSQYRHIDTAQVYGNEPEVGHAASQSNLPREELFLTSKILFAGTDHAATVEKVLESVEKVGGRGGYLDLMLIHNVTAGAEGIRVIWQAMEECFEKGRIRAIGVSNFGVGRIEQMKGYAKVWPPVVNQLELHPWCQQREIVSYCHKNGIAVEAYCPLVRNQKADDSTLTAVAKKHGKTTAQVLIRYCLEKDWIPLPKSDNPDRIAQNADVFDFKLDAEDVKKLDGVKQETPLVMAADNEDVR